MSSVPSGAASPPEFPVKGAEPGPTTAATDAALAPAPLRSSLSERAAILVILGLVLGLLMGSLDQFVVLTALGQIVSDLGHPNGVTFVVSAYLITSTIAVPIFAKLSDILSRRNVFLVGLSIFIAGSALAGLSQNLSELIVFRGVQGFGSGCFFPVGLSIIAATFTPAARARLTGALSGVFGIATVAGPFLGSFIVDHVTWRWVFYVNIPLGLLGMAVIATCLGPLRPSRRAPFDYVGAGLLSIWVGSLTYALFQVTNSGWAWSDLRIVALLATAVGVFAVFAVFEFRHPNPVVPLRLFRDRIVAVTATVAFLSRSVVFSLLTFLAVYVGLILLHAGPGSADTVRDVTWFLVIPLIFGAAVGGQLITRIAYRPLVASGMALVVLGMFALTRVSASTPVWSFTYGLVPTGGIVLPLVPMGFGLGLTLGPTTLMAQYRVAAKDIGAATGLIQFLGTLGASIGLSLFTTYQSWQYGLIAPTAPPAACQTAPPPPSCVGPIAQYQQANLQALVTSFHDLFVVMLVLAIAALAVSLLLQGRMPKVAPTDSGAAVGSSV
jgi:EmrB/QacA subfamily drug resistance transporter